MVNKTPENPRNTVKFDSLANLREELSKQAHNAERLDEFQKTIDEAIEKWDREGIIEFTEDEWKSLITNEDLPPIEQVKTLLRNKIEWMKEVKKESKEKREWIMGELDKKVDEAKKAVEEVKEKATGSIKEALSPLEKIKDGLENAQKSLWEMWTNLWTPIKFAWYTLWASLGFKFGKEALAAMTKEKTEEAVEKAKEKVTGSPEAWEEKPEEERENANETVENLPLFAGLSATALGIFWVIKNKLPAGLSRSLDWSGGGILKSIARNKALRMFGVGWALLFWISQISNALENPEIANKVWPMPDNPEERKTWIAKLLSYCGDIGETTKNALVDFYSQSKDVITGKTLDAYLTKKEAEEEIPEDMQRLEEAFWPTMRYLQNLWYDINYMARNGAVVIWALSVLSPSIRGIASRGAMTWLQLGWFLLSTIGKNLISTLLVIGIAYNATVIAGHKILIPKDPDKMKDWLRDLIQLPDIREQLEKEWVDASLLQHAEENLDEAVTLLTDEEKREERLKQEKEKVMTKLKDIWLSLLAPEREKLVQSKNLEWLQHAEKSLTHFLQEPNEREKAFIQKIQALITKVSGGSEISATDIADLITASTGTRVVIHNKNDAKYIRWSIVDEAGFVIDDKAADNLCVNPKIDKDEQYHAARTMSVAQSGVLGAAAAGIEWFIEGARYPLTQLREALNTNKIEEGASILQKILNNKIPIIQVGSKIFIDGFMFPANLIMDACAALSWEITMQEFMMETWDGIVPCMVFGASTGVVNNWIKALTWGKTDWKMSRMLFSWFTWTRQLKMLRQWVWLVFHGPQKFEIWYKGFLGMLDDKRIKFEAWLEQMIQEERRWRYAFGGIFSGENMRELSHIARDLVHLEQMKKHISLAENANKRSDGNMKKEHIKRAKEYAENWLKHNLPEPERESHFLFNITQIPDDADSAQIRNMLSSIETDINTRSTRRSTIRTTQQATIRQQAAAINRLPSNHPRWSRLKKAKWIAGILAIIAIPVWASLRADALNNHETANEETDDLWDSYEAPDYGEFEWDISKSEKVDNYAPEMRWVFQEIDTIKDTLIGENDTDTMKLMLENSVDFYMKNDEEKVKTMIAGLTPRYEASVIKFRKICQENKEALERYFKENPDKQDKELKICAFLWLGWTNEKLEFRSMSKDKFEKHFYTTFDHVKDNLSAYQDDGQQSGWEKTGEVAKNIVPVVSSWIDTKQAYRDFSRGHIKSWLLNGGMAALWWASDISLGITAAASILSLGTASPSLFIPATLRGITVAAKSSKVVKWIIMTERVAEVATQTAQGVYLAVEKDQKEYL